MNVGSRRMTGVVILLAGLGLVGCAWARDVPPNWQSPRTNRRHLQPPLAERMVTLCSEGRLILSPVHYDPKECWGRYRYENLQGDAFWFVRGEAVGLFDPKTVKVVLPEDGVPLHDLEETSNGVTVRLETCCDFVHKPTVHGRLVVRNDSTEAYRERFTVRVRHGAETELIRTKNGTGPDFYCVYEPYREAWAALTNDWSLSGRCLTSPEGGFMNFRTLPEGATWDAVRGELGFELQVRSGAECAFEFSFGAGTVVEPDFAVVRTQTAAAWRRELARLNRLPRHIAENPLRRRTVQNLTVQTLQCLQRPVGCDFVLPRQGGQHRNVWPWDCAAALWPFSKLGDFDDYYEGVLAFFFDIYGQPGNYSEPRFAGRIGPFPIDWACNTANVLGILSRYCLDTGNRRVWEKYRVRALEGFRWINGFRVKPGEGKNLLVGLFRPIRSTDYDSAGQNWTITDPHNLEELKDYLAAAERFDDPALDEIRSVYTDYFAALTAASRQFKSTMTDDTFRQPLIIRDGKAIHDRVRLAYIVEFAFEAGVLSAEDVRWIWERSVEGGVATMRGLNARYPVHGEWGDVHIWYTTAQDAIWHRMLRRAGERELADRTLEATLRYAMTPEMYLGERYCDMNPDYLPWSPNASGSGRVIRMLYEAK